MRVNWLKGLFHHIGLSSAPKVPNEKPEQGPINQAAIDQVLSSNENIPQQINIENQARRIQQLTNIGFLESHLTHEHIQLFDGICELIESKKMVTNLLEISLQPLTTLKSVPLELFKAACFAGAQTSLDSTHLEDFKRTFNWLISSGASQKLLELYLNTYAVFKQKNWTLFTNAQHTDYNIFHIFEKLTQIKPIENMMNTLNKDLLSSQVEGFREAVFLLKEIAVHTAACIIHETKDIVTKYKAADYIRVVGNNDHAPYKEDSKEAEQFHRETNIAQNRMFRVYHGFGALTHEAKRIDQDSHWLLARFGNDVAEQTHYLWVNDQNNYPGMGVMISGVILESLFVQDEKAEDPFWRYKEAWTWAKTALNEIRGADFFFTRGFIAISCPSNKRFQLDGVHYTYLICNDHFENNGLYVALLVPTNSFYKKISGSAIPFDEFLHFSPLHRRVKGLDEVNFLLQAFIEEAELEGINVLDIGGGTCVGGGLCNAYPPDSKPYHEWEQIRRGHENQNYAGHIHKSHKEGGYKPGLRTPYSDAPVLMGESMKGLRKAHRLVYKIIKGYQDIFDVLRLKHATWHKGFTLSASDRGSEDKVNLVQEAYSSNGYENASTPLRMLQEAYDIRHKLIRKGITNPDKYPILVKCDALDYWKLPDYQVFMLDTHDMVAHLEHKTIQLSKDEIGAQEKKLWYNKVLPLVANDSRTDLRLYSRKELISGHPAPV